MSFYSVRLIGQHTVTSRTIVNTLYYRDAFPDNFDFVPADLPGIADAVYADIWGVGPHVPLTNYRMKDLMPSVYTLQSINVSSLDGALNLWADFTHVKVVGEAASGGDGNNNLPSSQHLTLVARFDTGTNNPFAPVKGRLYISPVREDIVNQAGVLLPQWVADWSGVGERMATNLVDPNSFALYFPIRIARKFLSGAFGTGYRDINGFQCMNQVGNLRKRNG